MGCGGGAARAQYHSEAKSWRSGLLRPCGKEGWKTKCAVCTKLAPVGCSAIPAVIDQAQ